MGSTVQVPQKRRRTRASTAAAAAAEEAEEAASRKRPQLDPDPDPDPDPDLDLGLGPSSSEPELPPDIVEDSHHGYFDAPDKHGIARDEFANPFATEEPRLSSQDNVDDNISPGDAALANDGGRLGDVTASYAPTEEHYAEGPVYDGPAPHAWVDPTLQLRIQSLPVLENFVSSLAIRARRSC